MALDLENYESFSAAIEGLPKVVELIASVPEVSRSLALAAARQSYQQTAQALGYEESEARHWVSAIPIKAKECALIGAEPRAAAGAGSDMNAVQVFPLAFSPAAFVLHKGAPLFPNLGRNGVALFP